MNNSPFHIHYMFPAYVYLIIISIQFEDFLLNQAHVTRIPFFNSLELKVSQLNQDMDYYFSSSIT